MQCSRANALIGLFGLLLLSTGVAVYSWPAGLIALGAGLFIDALAMRRAR